MEKVHLRPHLSWLGCKNSDGCPTAMQSWAFTLEHISLFLSPCWTRITSLRVKAACKQRCNVVEQTPSRLRVAAHFVCSIYQSKTDNEIYEWNKGNYRARVNNGSQRKRNIHFYFIIFEGTQHKVQKQLVKIENLFQAMYPKGLPKYYSGLRRSAVWWSKRQKRAVGIKYRV